MLLFHALLCTDDGGTRRLQNSVRGQGMEGSPQADVEQDSGECGFSDAEEGSFSSSFWRDDTENSDRGEPSELAENSDSGALGDDELSDSRCTQTAGSSPGKAIAMAAFDPHAPPNSFTGALDWQAIADLLRGFGPLAPSVEPVRPHNIRLVRCRQMFLERPKKQRRQRLPGTDKWFNSGGKKGGGEHWLTPSLGVRKAYCRIDPRGQGKPAEHGCEFRLLHGSQGDPKEAGPVLFIVDTLGDPSTDRADSNATGSEMSRDKLQPTVAGDVVAVPGNTASMDIKIAAEQPRFISFQSAPQNGSSTSIELGAIVKQDKGVTLISRQGDFAEWYRRKPGEAPLEEGDVVGFQSGGISRKTTGARMFGVVSRRAVVEGSAPPEDERPYYDTVAHVGVVPVKVIRAKLHAGCSNPCRVVSGPQTGDTLVPSGRNDGTAVIAAARRNSNGFWQCGGCVGFDKRIAVVVGAQEWDGEISRDEHQLVMSAVINPPETRENATRRVLRPFWLVMFGLVMLSIVLSLWAILSTIIKSQISSKDLSPSERCINYPHHDDLIAASLSECSSTLAASTIYNKDYAVKRRNLSVLYTDAALLGLPNFANLSLARRPQWPVCVCECGRECGAGDYCRVSGDRAAQSLFCCAAGLKEAQGRIRDLCDLPVAPPFPVAHWPPTLADLSHSLQAQLLDQCSSCMADVIRDASLSPVQQNSTVTNAEGAVSRGHQRRALRAQEHSAAAPPSPPSPECFPSRDGRSYTLLATPGKVKSCTSLNRQHCEAIGYVDVVGVAQPGDACGNHAELSVIESLEECWEAYTVLCQGGGFVWDSTANEWRNSTSPNRIDCDAHNSIWHGQLISLNVPPKPPGCMINTNVALSFNPKFNPDLNSTAGLTDGLSAICVGCVGGSSTKPVPAPQHGTGVQPAPRPSSNPTRPPAPWVRGTHCVD